MPAASRPPSFSDLIRHHTSYLVNPLQWTSRHLDLVECRFQDVATTPSENPPNHNSGKSSHQTSNQRSDAENLAKNWDPIHKRCSLFNILVKDTRLFAGLSKGNPFYFQGRRVRRLPTYVMFIYLERAIDTAENRTPTPVGYLQYNSIHGARRKLFEACPGPRGESNRVGGILCWKRMQQITLEEWTEDPYFVCPLLALAQFEEQRRDESSPVTFTSRLLVTEVADKEKIVLYEADIATELLDGLKDPKKANRPMNWPIVRRKQIPYQPYSTFPERITAELQTPGFLPHDRISSIPDSSVPDMDGKTRTGQKRPQNAEEGTPCKQTRISDAS
ncbi:hypothetical protein ASPACDRAFT_128049 [Aspergillus aculeatus ATCC 16872]|uniref:Uncharacterized protein n=1 Tax=Aspergillus aculeatus (strain ATCC 16872 / CBS 172.66 / WB 5094) TaxID=690307 RepID=A0A1L9WES2_ASPA1|nr:uncharacterized protein ASPACDRAFT_128049 [Aspergillus aculeatus ATCC 16872]OJJ94671.1 hypothetical protein ASPACDRAFT_128049 [Aspergillus aculeatus ATCC 16872]